MTFLFKLRTGARKLSEGNILGIRRCGTPYLPTSTCKATDKLRAFGFDWTIIPPLMCAPRVQEVNATLKSIDKLRAFGFDPTILLCPLSPGSAQEDLSGQSGCGRGASRYDRVVDYNYVLI